ncbi:MAG: hypothetical protein IKE35_03505 [Lachnospiraceae bacterium]|nr:hypothetical protein [Lachnospiraceae bacterium]
MYGQEVNLREQIIEEYRDDLVKLLKYLPFLDKKGGKDVTQFYEGDEKNKVIPVPVYDSTLLAFVKEARTTKFMNKNYPYIYRKWKMPTPNDERIAMESATIRDMDLFRGIMSKYVLEGQRKSVMWTTAVEERIFVTALTRLRSLMFDYSKEPLSERPR